MFQLLDEHQHFCVRKHPQFEIIQPGEFSLSNLWPSSFILFKIQQNQDYTINL